MPIVPMMILAAGTCGVLLLMMLAFSGPSAEKVQKRRLGSLKERHSGSAGVAVEAQLRRIVANRETRMDGFAAQFIPNPALLRKRIAMTGKNWTVGQYGLASAGGFLVIALLLYLRGAPPLLALFIGLFAGLGIPHKTISFLIKRRVTKFTARFPDAIELLVRGLRAGLPITETITVVASEVPGPVGEEFRGISDKMKIGRTMDAALQETADRLGTAEFQFFCITLAIQRETGGNLAETLSNLADVLRKRSQMKLKIKAMSSESKASAYIIGALPFIVFGLIWFINGSYMQNFFVEPRLIAAGIGGIIWMSIGAFIMAQMINFEI